MSDETKAASRSVNLKELVEHSGLLDSLQDVEQVEESMYRMRAGSAMLVVGVKERTLVIISPMFKSLPQGRESEFCYRLLQLNSSLGGIVNFAIQPDGWVVMHGGRDTTGMDTEEFRTLIGAVAAAADHFDNALLEEFYAPAGREEASSDDEADPGAASESADSDGAIDADIEE